MSKEESVPRIRMVSLNDITPNPDNPRVNSSAVASVAESIRLFGFRVPIVLNGDNMILAGHTRYRAAANLQLTEVPCMFADDLSEEEQAAFSIADNRTSDFAFFDLPKLEEQIADISPELLVAFDIDALLEGQDDDDEGKPAAAGAPEKRKGLDLAPFERYQYVTIICRTEFDYTNLLTRLGLENIQKGYVDGVLKRGASYGRVIEYSDFSDREEAWAEDRYAG